MIRHLYNRLKSLIKAATLTATDDTGVFRYGTISALGKSQKANVFTPYGLIHNPPADSLGIVVLLQGEESKSIVIADDPKRRVKGLVEGEVGIANYLTGTHFIMKENGDWDIQVNGNANVTITGDATMNISGDLDITTGGKTTIDSGGNFRVIAPRIDLN